GPRQQGQSSAQAGDTEKQNVTIRARAEQRVGRWGGCIEGLLSSRLVESAFRLLAGEAQGQKNPRESGAGAIGEQRESVPRSSAICLGSRFREVGRPEQLGEASCGRSRMRLGGLPWSRQKRKSVRANGVALWPTRAAESTQVQASLLPAPPDRSGQPQGQLPVSGPNAAILP